LLTLGAVGAALVAGSLAVVPAVRAGLYANLGAVRLAQAELAGWPSATVAGRPSAEAEAWLRQALALDPGNRAAALRLGALALARGDFLAAASILEPARQAGGERPAFRKALGYAYLWLGRMEAAGSLLASISEAPVELYEYARWWRAQDRADLAARAEQMRAWLSVQRD
jgi:tetratricopeptide (TPR) repeat protein